MGNRLTIVFMLSSRRLTFDDVFPQTDLSVGVLAVLVEAPMNSGMVRWCCPGADFIDFYNTKWT